MSLASSQNELSLSFLAYGKKESKGIWTFLVEEASLGGEGSTELEDSFFLCSSLLEGDSKGRGV